MHAGLLPPMPVTTHEAQRCRERAAVCRHLALRTPDPELSDGYLRLAISYEILAESVLELDRTESWFAAKLAEASPGSGANGIFG